MTGAERLLAACRSEPVDEVPVWFMRQAGGSLPRYLELRERHSVEVIATTPELCAEVSLLPVETYGVDGAVLFADIMLPLTGMGIELTLTPEGPRVDNPIRTIDDVGRLRPFDPQAVAGILEAIGIVRRELAGRAAVIGLTGAPFTLASYLIEGGPSRDQLATRAFMHREPAAWGALLHRLAVALAAYVAAQVRAGVDVIQVFDSWAGSLPPADYADRVGVHSRALFAAADPVPTIHFVAGSAGILEQVAAAGGDVIAIDARQSLARARERLPADLAVQGNLDPARLLAGWPAIEAGAAAVLAEAGARPGHIFNLGHAAPRETDPALLRELTAYVHDSTRSRLP